MVKELFFELAKVSVIVQGSDRVRLESIVGVVRESFFLLFGQQSIAFCGIGLGFRVSYSSPPLSAFIFSPSSLPCFRSFGPHKSILDSLVKLDPVKVFENCKSVLHSSMTISLWDLRGIEGFEPEDKPWDFALPPSMELDGQGNLLSEEHDSGPTKLLSKEHYVPATACDRYFSMSDK